MPDANGHLSPAEQQQAVAWLTERWGPARACPYHGPTDWGVGPVLFQLSAFTPGGITLGGAVLPLVTVTCGVCGHTVFVNAISMGLVRADTPPVETPTATHPPEA